MERSRNELHSIKLGAALFVAPTIKWIGGRKNG